MKILSYWEREANCPEILEINHMIHKLTYTLVVLMSDDGFELFTEQIPPWENYPFYMTLYISESEDDSDCELFKFKQYTQPLYYIDVNTIKTCDQMYRNQIPQNIEGMVAIDPKLWENRLNLYATQQIYSITNNAELLRYDT